MTNQALAGPTDSSCKLFQAGQGRVSQGELAFAMSCPDLTGYVAQTWLLQGLALTWLSPGLWFGRH